MKQFLVTLALVLGAAPISAQWLDRPWTGIPRTADGAPDLTAPTPRGPDGKPDLTGIWDGDPPLARLDPTILEPWVMELALQRQQAYYRERPYYQCLPSGPEAEQSAGWKRIVQTPAMIVILDDELTYRVIHMDGRELEANPVPSWTGYSVGRWEGDTLVVESNGYNEQTWLSRRGVSHSEQLHITERYERTDFGHLQIEVTITDPGAFSEPWGYDVEMELAADTEMLEAVCDRSSDAWSGSLSDFTSQAIDVPVEILERYVGSYTGVYGGSERTFDVVLSDGELVATITRGYTSSGLGAAGLGEGAPRVLVPQSETLFDGLGLSFQFVVGAEGVATELIVTHISGNYTYTRDE